MRANKKSAKKTASRKATQSPPQKKPRAKKIASRKASQSPTTPRIEAQPKPPKSKSEKIKVIQWDLENDIYGRPLKQDGVWGPLTQGALDKLIHGIEPEGGVHPTLASSFADPADIAAFDECKAEGHSDDYCFKYGDNGIGAWGDNTKEGSGPSVAFPPETMEETWGSTDNAHNQSVVVRANGSSVYAKVKDKMPHRKNITNGTGIDLNPDSCKALGYVPPILEHVTWEAVS